MLLKANLKNLLSIGHLISALFYSTLFIGIYLKWNRGMILSNFDRRIISVATLSGVDVNGRVTLYYKAIVLGVLGVIFFLYLFKWVLRFLQNLAKNSDKNIFSFEIKFFNLISFIGIITIAFGIIGSGWKLTVGFILCFQFLILIILVGKSLAVRNYWKNIKVILSNNHLVIWQFLNTFVFMFYLEYIGKTFHLFSSKQHEIFYLIGFMVNILFTYGLFRLLVEKMHLSETRSLKMIVLSLFPLFITPVYLPIANEIYLILNQKGIFFVSPHKILLVLFLISVLVIIFTFYFSFKNKLIKSISTVLRNMYYPLFLLMMTAIVYQPSVKLGPPSELFESGNTGIAIQQFFQFGKIPILETFNAHAFSELVAPIIFSFLNGYQGWASHLYDDLVGNIIYMLVSYFFLRKIISDELSLLTLSFFPFGILSGLILPGYFIVGLVAIFVMQKIIREPSLINYFVFCIMLSLIFIWRFDVGASAIPSALIVYILYLLIYKGRWSLKNLIAAGVITGVIWLSAIVLIAIIRDVPILFRLKELISVVSSNQIWGYATLGDSQKLNYFLYYLLVPVINLGLFAFILYKVKFLEKIKPEIFTSVLYLTFFNLINLPRGLVRHSLIENESGMIIILGFLTILLALLPFIVWNQRSRYENYVKFSIIVISISLFFLSSTGGTRVHDNSIFSNTIERFTSFTDYHPTNTKIERYEEPIDYRLKTFASLKRLFDETMGPQETFIDFSNSPYLYVLTKRVTPMYINQTPAFLSDEISQNSYLNEIESNSIPYVLFADKQGWTGLDGVPSNIRSYRVAEYIYNHYVPFVKVNGLDVWVRVDRRTEIESKLMYLQNKEPQGSTLYSPAKSILTQYNTFDMKSFKVLPDGLMLQTGPNDPQLYGILPTNDQKEITLDKDGEYSLQLQYSTEKGGKLQVFYRLNDQPFKEENSVFVDLGSPGNHRSVQIQIPFNGVLKDIRLDPPSDDTFMVHSLAIYKQDSNHIQYEILHPPLSDLTDISWLPFYWGEEDPLHANIKTKILANLASNDTLLPGKKKNYIVNVLLDKRNGNYIHISMKSKENLSPYKITIEYGGSAQSDKTVTGSYTFNVKADGQYHDYLIRVSSQYIWYEIPIKFLSISSETETDLRTVNIRKGD